MNDLARILLLLPPAFLLLACEKASQPASSPDLDVPVIAAGGFPRLQGEPTIVLTHWYATVANQLVAFERSEPFGLAPIVTQSRFLVEALVQRGMAGRAVSIAAEPSLPYHSLFRAATSARIAGADASLLVARHESSLVTLPLVIPKIVPDYDEGHYFVRMENDVVRLEAVVGGALMRTLVVAESTPDGYRKVRDTLDGQPEPLDERMVEITIWPTRYVTVDQLAGAVSTLKAPAPGRRTIGNVYLSFGAD